MEQELLLQTANGSLLMLSWKYLNLRGKLDSSFRVSDDDQAFWGTASTEHESSGVTIQSAPLIELNPNMKGVALSYESIGIFYEYSQLLLIQPLTAAA